MDFPIDLLYFFLYMCNLCIKPEYEKKKKKQIMVVLSLFLDRTKKSLVSGFVLSVYLFAHFCVCFQRDVVVEPKPLSRYDVMGDFCTKLNISKQCSPRSDCSYRSSLILVCTVC